MQSRQRHGNSKADNNADQTALSAWKTKSCRNWAQTSDSITLYTATTFKVCQMFHKRRTASKPAESWQSTCDWTHCGMWAGCEKVVGVMLQRPRLGQQPRGSLMNSGNIKARHESMRKKYVRKRHGWWGGDICHQLRRRNWSHSWNFPSPPSISRLCFH